MKKFLILFIITLVQHYAFAQLKVQNDGKVHLACTNPVNMSAVSVAAGNDYSFTSDYSYGLFSNNNSGNYTIGIRGSAWSYSGRSIGVQGLAGNTNLNIGVIGGLTSNDNGAGVFGTLTNHIGYEFTGRYAGYFDGPVHFTSTATIPQVITPSDIRLHENIVSLSESKGSALANVLDMNVIKYNFNDLLRKKAINDSTNTIDLEEKANRSIETHYGLSAQELRNIYPELVKEGQDGYLGVNYLELIPILIRSIQELKQELDEIKGEGKASKTRSESRYEHEIAIASTSSNILYQNSPNPFKEQTSIRFKLANDVQDASICFFDMNGRLLKKMPVSSGMDSVSIGGYELGEGMFLYSLIINGQDIDTKKMMITK